MDINQAVVTKLTDRGSHQAFGVVTDVGLFVRALAEELIEDHPNKFLFGRARLVERPNRRRGAWMNQPLYTLGEHCDKGVGGAVIRRARVCHHASSSYDGGPKMLLQGENVTPDPKTAPISLPPPRPKLRVEPWHDALIDEVGYDPRSDYVEAFWLPVLGPSTTWLAEALHDPARGPRPMASSSTSRTRLARSVWVSG